MTILLVIQSTGTTIASGQAHDRPRLMTALSLKGRNMWTDINGERKKVACGPCIRGHRSSKCDHRDRVLIDVRKPGRPLSSCPHPGGSCSCERVVINYTVPKTSESACPPDRATPAASRNSNHVQKSLQKKFTTTLTASALEKAIKASHLHNADNDASSELTRTSTDPFLAASERSTSSGAPPPSSTSSTPRLHPTSPQEQARDVDARPSEMILAGTTADGQANGEFALSTDSPIPMNAQSSQGLSNCCKPKHTRRQSAPIQQQQAGGCCGGRLEEPPKQVPAKKSCCAGPSQAAQPDFISQMNGQQDMFQTFANFPQLLQHNPFQTSPHGAANGSNPSISATSNYMSNPSNNIPLLYPFNHPIYNQLRSSYQQPSPTAMPPLHNATNRSSGHAVDHNCCYGDFCSCFGCAAYPDNAAMIEYAQLMYHYMSTGGFGTFPLIYDLRTYPHQADHGAENRQHMAFNTNQPANFAQQAPGHLLYSMSMNNMMGVSNPSANVSGPWQQGALQPPAQARPMQDTQYMKNNNPRH